MPPIDDLIDRARSGDERAFRELTDPHRRELQVHCYRILGSLQDAEDMVQETLFAAWRGLEGFEERASVRAWLYRIATNRCLNALRDSRRRPSAGGQLPFDPPDANHPADPSWLEPYPDSLLEDPAAGPEARYEGREAVTLAFVVGLQQLPALQRAVLVLRDVLGFRAAEVAEMLDTSDAAVNSGLQRARAALEARRPPRRDRVPLPHSAAEREFTRRFADAFEAADVEGVVALLTDDALITMPPRPLAYRGPERIGEFLWLALRRPGAPRFVMHPLRANGQPAFAYWLERPDSPGTREPGGLFVLSLAGDGIDRITRFRPAVLDRFR